MKYSSISLEGYNTLNGVSKLATCAVVTILVLTMAQSGFGMCAVNEHHATPPPEVISVIPESAKYTTAINETWESQTSAPT